MNPQTEAITPTTSPNPSQFLAPATVDAIRHLGVYTYGSFDLWTLAGARRASLRALLLTTLTGKSTPKSKAGIDAIRRAFYAELQIVGECEAEREENFRFVCAEIIASQTQSERSN